MSDELSTTAKHRIPAPEFLEKYAHADLEVDCRWFGVRDEKGELVGANAQAEGMGVMVRQWAQSGFHLRMRDNLASPDMDPVVLCAPAGPKTEKLINAAPPTNAWVFVSADFPDRYTVALPMEGLAWAKQVLRETDARLRLTGPREPQAQAAGKA